MKVRDSDPPRITADMAVVIDERSGAILYGRDEHREVAPASLTKIVTAMVALEMGNPSARVTVDVDSRVMWDSTVMGLRPGEEVSLEDLLYGLMLPSGNDAAIAIARHVARGNEGLFADLMNAKVHQLGLRHSHFVNPHGLDADRHYSSAYDMAMLARQGMRHPLFRQLAAAKEWEALRLPPELSPGQPESAALAVPRGGWREDRLYGRRGTHDGRVCTTRRPPRLCVVHAQ